MICVSFGVELKMVMAHVLWKECNRYSQLNPEETEEEGTNYKKNEFAGDRFPQTYDSDGE